MRPDFWELMNGQCFGDDPFAEKTEYELDVPEFMTNRGYAVPEIPVAAYCGQAAGRVKRRQHLTERNRRRSVNAAFWMAVGFGLLVLAVNLPEWIF